MGVDVIWDLSVQVFNFRDFECCCYSFSVEIVCFNTLSLQVNEYGNSSDSSEVDSDEPCSDEGVSSSDEPNNVSPTRPPHTFVTLGSHVALAVLYHQLKRTGLLP